MAGCDPRRRASRALGCGAVVLAAAVAGAISGPAGADPAPGSGSEPVERAKDLYRSAEAAMKDGRFDDAARDYGAAYELSQDPALFFKIGHANERAGKCDVALVYYARYLRDGKPNEQFTELTRTRIEACGGSIGSGSAGAGSAHEPSTGSATGSAAPPPPATPAAPPPPAVPAAAPPPAAPAAAAEPVPPTAPVSLVPPTRQKIGWLLGGSAIAFATLGGVLAYAARSSENDVRDLYAGLGGQIPTFDGATRKRYNDLVDEGQRYEHLSWLAFGLAGAAAVGVTVLFAVGRDEPAPPAAHAAAAPVVTPVIGPRGAGVSVRF